MKYGSSLPMSGTVNNGNQNPTLFSSCDLSVECFHVHINSLHRNTNPAAIAVKYELPSCYLVSIYFDIQCQELIVKDSQTKLKILETEDNGKDVLAADHFRECEHL
ncbi:unnamed protein product [Heterobilharzia americana]|nr:unnamed protein product [Heterobilharzia americana]